MTNANILYPVFAQVALTIVLLLAMGRARVAAVRSREVKVRDIALGQSDPWPARAKALARAYHNQLETPILFYVVVTLAIATKHVTLPLVVLAWAYVAMRLIHAFVHTGTNDITQRFGIFILGVAVLIAMWVLLGVYVVTGG